MGFDFNHISKSQDIHEFRLPNNDPRDYWWPKLPLRLQVAWLPSKKIGRPSPGMIPHRFNGQREIWVKEDREFLLLWRQGFSLSLNTKQGRAIVKISRENDWQSVLRVLYFFGFLKERGLLLHASSLVNRGMAYVFPGGSGAGKTTIVRLSPDLTLLTDEITALQLIENNQVVGHGTPFFGDLGQPGEKLTVPVKGLYFPLQSVENRVVPLNTQETAKRLLSCVCSYTTNVERLKKIFTLSLKLAERIPGHVLHFRRESGFWRAIDGS